MWHYAAAHLLLVLFVALLGRHSCILGCLCRRRALLGECCLQLGKLGPQLLCVW